MLVRGRGFSLRKSFYSKLILIVIIVSSCIFYFKYLTVNENSIVNNVNINQYEKLIRLDISKQSNELGSNGDVAILSGIEKDLGEKNLATIALNEELSEHISYNRSTPDARNPLCRNEVFDLDILPTASIVVIFYNEPYSVLVRTVHSILNTCDKKILNEVILVDDASTNDELKDKLDYYIQTRFPKDVVKIIRLKNR